MSFSNEEFEKALALPRLKGHIPEFLPGNRSGPKVRAMNEAQLNAQTKQWFIEFEKKLDFYEKHGLEVGFLLEWTKKYWWSWLTRDMSLNHELYIPEVRWKDPSSFGHDLVGIPEFEKYNFAFFDAIPDWRYDPLPNQIYLDVTPEDEVRFAVRYIGSGHWSGPLRFHPYDDTAPAMYGNGDFVQAPAIDRYHFNKEGRLQEGETVFDVMEAGQVVGLLPSGDSWALRTMMNASGKLQKIRALLR